LFNYFCVDSTATTMVQLTTTQSAQSKTTTNYFVTFVNLSTV